MSRKDQTLTAIFAAPLLLAALSLIGLTVALLDDGAGDVMGAALLATPVAAILWARITRERRGP